MATAALIGMGVAIAGALVALIWLPARASTWSEVEVEVEVEVEGTGAGAAAGADF